MIKERVIQLLENKGIAKEKFYEKIGITSANFRGNAKKTPLNSTAIENILSEIPDLNLEWLLTGKGSMLKSEEISRLSQNITGNSNNQSGNDTNITGNSSQQVNELQKQLKERDKEIERLKAQVDKLFKMIP